MIRSSKVSLKFSNQNKLDSVHLFIEEYRKVMKWFVDKFWEAEKIPALFKKEQYLELETWLGTRMIQCAAKQASGIMRGTKQKQKQRKFVIEKMIRNGEFKKARKLQLIYDETVTTKPDINSIECELDERFPKISFENNTTFDGWVTLTCIGNKLKLILPIKKHKHFNKMMLKGSMKKGIRLSNKSITFMFEIKDPIQKETGSTIGIDIGQTTTLSLSNGFSLNEDKHGHTYKSICEKLSRKKQGSKNFNQTQIQRTNYLHWLINQLNLDGIKIVNREDIKYLRRGRRSSRSLSHWNYGELFGVLDNKLMEQGVLVNKLNPAYTSQRCSKCTRVRKGNRCGKKFKCDRCSHEQDADLNAATNLSLNLLPITAKERLQYAKGIGFDWGVASEESIVPHTIKT